MNNIDQDDYVYYLKSNFLNFFNNILYSNQKQFAQVAPELSTKVWADKPAKVENKRGLTAMMNDVIQEYTNEANKLAQNSKPKNTDHDKKIQTMMTNINDTADQIKHAKVSNI